MQYSAYNFSLLTNKNRDTTNKLFCIIKSVLWNFLHKLKFLSHILHTAIFKFFNVFDCVLAIWKMSVLDENRKTAILFKAMSRLQIRHYCLLEFIVNVYRVKHEFAKLVTMGNLVFITLHIHIIILNIDDLSLCLKAISSQIKG